MTLRALARVNLAAIERNAAHLRADLTGDARLCAVVKANASGHGAVQVARASLAGGAAMLAVATAGEAAELRAAGIGAPVLVMGALSADELPVALGARAEVAAWTDSFVADLVAAVTAGRAGAPIRVHVKYDSGMGRLGTRDRDAAVAVVERVLAAAPALELAGAMTHFATADGDLEYLDAQLQAFAPFAAAVRTRAPRALIHTANSAATVREPRSHFDLVRCGIAIYGCDPMNRDPDDYGLEPALELTSYVAAVKLAEAGDSIGYGRRFVAARDTWIATLPMGYADAIRRALSNDCDVLIGGRRYPLVGTVSMDNVTVALGSEPTVRVGDIATVIGRDGEERQTVEDLANRMDTIAHEVLCGISGRVRREYHRDGVPVSDDAPSARDRTVAVDEVVAR
jgi:alanine racemase